jgi:hypothetical protein
MLPTGGAPSGGATPTGGTADSGGAPPTGGAVTGGAAPTGGMAGAAGVVNPDPSCESSGTAVTGAPCTMDCDVPCGFNEIGMKHCTCVDGAYESCPCSPPDDLPDMDWAPYCIEVIGGVPGAGGAGGAATVNGLVDDYDEQECDTLYEACITAETNDTPRGCLCLEDASSGTGLAWACGSTNNWFDRPPVGAGGAGGAGGGGPVVNPDPNCQSSGTAVTGAECTMDCDVPCGFSQIGMKHCTCVDGAYESCPCSPPDDFPDDLVTAPYCIDVIGGVPGAGGAGGMVNGLVDDYDETECDALYDACITAETNDTARGCLCLESTSTTTGFEWSCGSTNNWFGRPE